MSERQGPQLPIPDWRAPFAFAYLRNGQGAVLVRVEPRVKDYRVSLDGLVLTGTELDVIANYSLGFTCKEVGRIIKRSDRRVIMALEQARNRNRLASRDELIAKAREAGVLDADFFTALENAANPTLT